MLAVCSYRFLATVAPVLSRPMFAVMHALPCSVKVVFALLDTTAHASLLFPVHVFFVISNDSEPKVLPNISTLEVPTYIALPLTAVFSLMVTVPDMECFALVPAKSPA